MDYEVRAVLKCRNCKIDAKGLEVDGVVTRVYCSQCGVEVLGEATINEMRSDLNHRFAEQKGREILYRDVMKIPGLRESPGNRVAHLDNPWPFVLEPSD